MRSGLARTLQAYAEKDGRGYPDWAVRYVPLVKRLYRKTAPTHVLEIGANQNGLARFWTGRIVAVDREVEHLRAARDTQRITPVVADMAALPFRSGAFDATVSVDTLEHIPDTLRDAALNEMIRVTAPRGTAVVAFPTGAASARAERLISRSYAASFGGKLQWLAEHSEFGLPETDRVYAVLTSLAGQNRAVTGTKNANILVWRCMWRIMLCGWPGRGNVVFQALLRAATPLLCRVHFGSCYRAMFWVEPVEQEEGRA